MPVMELHVGIIMTAAQKDIRYLNLLQCEKRLTNTGYMSIDLFEM